MSTIYYNYCVDEKNTKIIGGEIVKLEEINLLEVETKDGFKDILDLEEVDTINDATGIVTLKNGLPKWLSPDSVKEVRECLKNV